MSDKNFKEDSYPFNENKFLPNNNENQKDGGAETLGKPEKFEKFKKIFQKLFAASLAVLTVTSMLVPETSQATLAKSKNTTNEQNDDETPVNTENNGDKKEIINKTRKRLNAKKKIVIKNPFLMFSALEALGFLPLTWKLLASNSKIKDLENQNQELNNQNENLNILQIEKKNLSSQLDSSKTQVEDLTSQLSNAQNDNANVQYKGYYVNAKNSYSGETRQILMSGVLDNTICSSFFFDYKDGTIRTLVGYEKNFYNGEPAEDVLDSIDFCRFAWPACGLTEEMKSQVSIGIFNALFFIVHLIYHEIIFSSIPEVYEKREKLKKCLSRILGMLLDFQNFLGEKNYMLKEIEETFSTEVRDNGIEGLSCRPIIRQSFEEAKRTEEQIGLEYCERKQGGTVQCLTSRLLYDLLQMSLYNFPHINVL